MSERWAPAKMRIVWDNLYLDWVATNENGDSARFPEWGQAIEWVFRNWDYCAACDTEVAWHPEHDVCRNCGHRNESLEENSVYATVRSMVADGLMRVTIDRQLEERVWFEQRPNYLLDAEDVIALLPHLLPLDVREAMFDETEEEDNAA